MTQPTPYNKSTKFGELPDEQVKTHLDTEFSGVERTVDEVLANLALIQRDDGALKNKIVSYDSLSDQVRGMISADDAKAYADAALAAQAATEIASNAAQGAAAAATGSATAAAESAATIAAAESIFSAHIDNISNPHNVTPTQIGAATPADIASAAAAKLSLDGTNAMAAALPFKQIATPPTPAADEVMVYAKADGKLYRMTSAGGEKSIGGGPSLGADSIIRTNAQTISENITFPASTNGMSAGPITIAADCTVEIPAGSNWSIV